MVVAIYMSWYYLDERMLSEYLYDIYIYIFKPTKVEKSGE